MEPIPNPIYMVEGKVEIFHRDISERAIAEVFKLFDGSVQNSPAAAGKRESFEALSRNDTTHELFFEMQLVVEKTVRGWGETRSPYVSREQVMIYKDGARSPLHMDDQHGLPESLGRNKYLMHTQNQIACLWYIVTDDVEGGEFVFPKQDIVVPPKTGTMVIFPSNYLYPHEVKPVTAGKRIALARHFYVKGYQPQWDLPNW